MIHEVGGGYRILGRIVVFVRTVNVGPIVSRLATCAGGVDGNLGGGMMTVHIDDRSAQGRVEVGGVVSRGYEVSAGSRRCDR